MSDPAPLNFEEKLVRIYARSRLLRTLAFKVLKWRGLEVTPTVSVGKDLRLPHGAVGLVVHESTVIGNRVKIFQGVTIGRGDQYVPVDQLRSGGIYIGDDVIIGAGAKVLFRSGTTLAIGQGAVIGANSVVTHDIPPGEVWAGLPARKVNDNPYFDRCPVGTTARNVTASL